MRPKQTVLNHALRLIINPLFRLTIHIALAARNANPSDGVRRTRRTRRKMSNNVVLSTGVRANLLALQQTTDLITTTQTHLATGKKVNSALDNATNFFMANSFQTSVTNLNTLLDQMNLAQRTLDQANNGITQITNLLNSAKGTLSQALAATPMTATLTGTASGLTGATLLTSLGFAATDSITIS